MRQGATASTGGAAYWLAGAEVYTGDAILADHRVLVENGRIAAIEPTSPFPGRRSGARVVDASGVVITAGFIDLQVNGGGDVLFNASPEPDAVRAIVDAHARLGTTNLLPTFITGPPAGMRAAAAAVRRCRAEAVGEVLGIHYEGPVISAARRGVHEARHARRSFPLELVQDRGMARMVTLAPEVGGADLVRALGDLGVRVSIGHSDATYEETVEAVDAGASCVTHLYNAMRQLTGRDPGVVGAALARPEVCATVIADGVHCHLGAVEAAWRAKPAGALFLVSDAMPPVGGRSGAFSLGSLAVEARDGACTTEDGVLAGSALDMASAVRNVVRHVGVPVDEAFRMASAYPARFLGLGAELGSVRVGHRACLTLCDEALEVVGVVRDGRLSLR